MKTILFTAFLGCLFYSSAQDFQKRFEDDLYPMVSDAVSSSEKYGILIAGNTYDGEDGLVFRADTNGQVIWQYKLEWESDSLYKPEFNEVLTTIDSAFIISGRARKMGTTDYEAIALKIDTDGNLIWERRFNQGISTSDYSALTAMTDSTFCIAYGSRTDGQGVNLVQFSGDGVVQESYGLDLGAPFFATSIVSPNDSTIIVVGTLNPNTSPIGVIAEIELNGSVNWISRYPDLSIFDALLLEQNLFLVTSNSPNTSFFTKCDLNGTITDRKLINGGSLNLDEAKPHIYQLADTSLFVFIPYYMWSSVGYHVDTNGILLDALQPELIYAQAIPTHNGGTTMVGNGPFYGVKSLYDDHIGVIRRDSAFVFSQCLHIIGSSQFQDSTGVAPVSGNATIDPGPQSESITATVTPFDMEVVDGCILFIGSVNELEGFEFLSIYPNYSDGLFNIDLMDGVEAEIRVFNNLGQMVYSQNKLIGSTTLDLTGFEDGSYHFKAITTDGHVQNGTLLIRH